MSVDVAVFLMALVFTTGSLGGLGLLYWRVARDDVPRIRTRHR